MQRANANQDMDVKLQEAGVESPSTVEVNGLREGQADMQLQSSASTVRRLSAESQEFEFNKIGDMAGASSTFNGGEGAQQMPSADELFYKGQLLPLAVHYSMNAHEYSNCHNRHHHHWSASAVLNETSASPPTHLQEPNNKQPSEPCPSYQILNRDYDLKFSSSCRMDHLNQQAQLASSAPASLFDRCSSYRTHSSSSKVYGSCYCHSCCADSSATASADISSSSSSRDSNGSSQGSSMAPSTTGCQADTDMREHHHPCRRCCCHCHCHGPAPLQDCPKRKASGLMQTWRLLLSGLRRGSAHLHQARHNTAKSANANRAAGFRPAISYSAELTQVHPASSSGSGRKVQENGGRSMDAGGKLRRSATEFLQEAAFKKDSSSTGKENPTGEAKACVQSKARVCTMDVGACHNISRSSKWQGYSRRFKSIGMIKARLTTNSSNQSQAAEDMEARSLNISRKLSLEKKWSQSPLCDSCTAEKPTFSFHLGFGFRVQTSGSASCPASVISSPNHSGLLSPAPTSSASASAISTMQELHSAVQGAIAHCKQSNSVHLEAATNTTS